MTQPTQGGPKAASTAVVRTQEARARRRRGGPWGAFALRRLGGILLSFVVLVLVTFLIVPLIPGDPALVIAGEGATEADIERIRERLGLNESLIVQFFSYAADLLRFDLGSSFSTGGPVTAIIAARFPFTAQLALIAIVGILAIAVPAGLAVAVATRGGRNRWLDVGFNAVTGFFYSVPQYVMGTLLVAAFAIGLGWLPSGGAASRSAIMLPLAALMIQPICSVGRVVRREASVVLEQDFIRTARGWRLPQRRTNLRYVLPNVITTTLTLSGLILAAQLGGAIVIENVFNWPGLGQGIVAAILTRDYPTIRGIILVLGLLATLIIVVVDLVLAVIDPRNLGADHDS
ncbi:ABC transporter permease [Leucobacter sp. G161]|uniref:ABC transporter permease n=1 Tax=Leucobacter sp. G161 TaxID=663704 RepID=UPI000A917380|nr:ABC transporter permease [Leucobacter sp. G161]